MTLITAANGNLSAARGAKKDEFYTQLVDIEKELSHYRKHFEGKVVYLNCDDPRISNFFRYFSENFGALGLKRLIATCYQSEDPGQFSRSDSSRAVWLEYDGDKSGSRVPDANEIGVRPLKGDGDFRSAESIELLRQADIVVTNPPFSLFREFVAQLVEHDKQFIILGNMNALTYKEIFPLFQNNQMWYGPSIRSGDREFRVPADYPLEAAGTRVDAEGNRYIRVKGVRWFTNLDYDERHRDLELTKRYREADYPRYANFDAIEVGKTAEIPSDYAGLMGVPITFIDKYNPEQFEIVGSSKTMGQPMSQIAEKGTYQQGGPRFYLPTGRGYRRMYDRIVVRNRRLTRSSEDRGSDARVVSLSR
ncbi:adenine-specific methyltransferase EcoRI family protein [Microbacterium horticulturae]|uniref:Adenine-specific methyltransferase EcoRI family protein n=1 Tax=Microbacterium horticulturae TaxID=3028316 RepID=A0ABY8BWS4_9MICO|nr:adenine-specific methyltransferase EcoRI family protein [Microbacterium sp. KACC 23027]WEG08636.1 adenine-specific methyltransferase EcoRI family protein [Microbacterium sp. KACC 23027]